MHSVNFTVAEIPCSVVPIVYDEEKCVGCNRCVTVCQCDVLYPATEKGRHPVVLYPGECYYCGACVMECRVPGAIRLVHPLMNRARFVETRSPDSTD